MTDERTDRGLVKVVFAEPEGMTETLWAAPVAPGRFRIDGSAWFVYGVSDRDVVWAKPEEGGTGRWVFDGVAEPSGHSTFRISVAEGRSLADGWPALARLGARHENADGVLFSIDVPPGVDLDTVRGLLVDGEASGIWEWEQGNPPPPAD